MRDRDPRFGRMDFELLEREVKYQGFFQVAECRVRYRLFRGGWSEPVTRELFVRGPAVAVLLYDPELAQVVLCEQFRIGAIEDDEGPWMLELVAGIIEEGESVEEVALRESQEEAGCVPARLLHIVDYLVSPGGTNEKLSIYCGLVSARGMTRFHGLEHEAEDIRLLQLDAADAFRAVRAGEINNAATIIALQWLELNQVELAKVARREEG